jgi:hypothetical protein
MKAVGKKGGQRGDKRGTPALTYPPHKGGLCKYCKDNNLMATWKGLEPSTSAVTGQRSNQLSYQAKCQRCPACLVGDEGFEPPTSSV